MDELLRDKMEIKDCLWLNEVEKVMVDLKVMMENFPT